VADQGVTVRSRSPDFLFAIGFFSTADKLGILQVTNFAATTIVDAIARVDGVGEASLIGASEYSMRIWMNPTRMAALGITADDVAQAIRSQNIQASIGQVGAQPAPEGTQVQ